LIQAPVLGRHKVKNIYQLDVLKQVDPYSCGYYSFNNAYLVLQACLAKEEDIARVFLKKIKNSTIYSMHFHKMVRLLKQKATLEGNKSYPWTHKHLELGVMERPYMIYLVDEHEAAIKVGGRDIFTCLPDLGFYSLRNSIMEPWQMHDLQEVFEIFHSRPNYSHAFLIGITNHWATVVANQVDHQLELLYLDSRNEYIFSIQKNMNFK